MLKSGIYVITNIVNNKKYVGSSIDVKHRLKEHKNRLKNNTGCDNPMYGKNHSSETKKKISEKSIKRTQKAQRNSLGRFAPKTKNEIKG